MRIAVLSDIHGNVPALAAVLAALAPYDAIWQLGDIVGYGPEPDAVVARLRDEGALGVCGNHDAAALGRIDADWFNDDARTAVLWSAGQLSESSRAWLAELPERHVEAGFTLVHGSPRDPVWEYLYSTPVARANLDAFETRHCLVGHTHVPLVFREEDGVLETLAPSDGSTLSLDGRRTMINPGSVGQPRDGDPRASALLIDTEAATVTWRRVEYDVAETQRLMRQAGLPPRLIERLSHGL
ncbi:MAG TPA: metallophosphoesterase family protein [Candidatus Limnocylindrales bacterium]|nr:metallophosphoesterase family protein [Candidatus Limnocylindrales bacterium]